MLFLKWWPKRSGQTDQGLLLSLYGFLLGHKIVRVLFCSSPTRPALETRLRNIKLRLLKSQLEQIQDFKFQATILLTKHYRLFKVWFGVIITRSRRKGSTDWQKNKASPFQSPWCNPNPPLMARYNWLTFLLSTKPVLRMRLFSTNWCL